MYTSMVWSGDRELQKGTGLKDLTLVMDVPYHAHMPSPSS
jgi:hypothetical protein